MQRVGGYTISLMGRKPNGKPSLGIFRREGEDTVRMISCEEGRLVVTLTIMPCLILLQQLYITGFFLINFFLFYLFCILLFIYSFYNFIFY